MTTPNQPAELNTPPAPVPITLTAAGTIPLAHQATQIVPVTGAVQRGLVRLFGANYRTSIAGLFTAGSVIAGGVVQFCPKLLNGTFDRHELISLVFLLGAGAGVGKIGVTAKDKTVTGVEAA